MIAPARSPHLPARWQPAWQDRAAAVEIVWTIYSDFLCGERARAAAITRNVAAELFPASAAARQAPDGTGAEPPVVAPGGAARERRPAEAGLVGIWARRAVGCSMGVSWGIATGVVGAAVGSALLLPGIAAAVVGGCWGVGELFGLVASLVTQAEALRGRGATLARQSWSDVAEAARDAVAIASRITAA